MFVCFFPWECGAVILNPPLFNLKPLVDLIGLQNSNVNISCTFRRQKYKYSFSASTQEAKSPYALSFFFINGEKPFIATVCLFLNPSCTLQLLIVSDFWKANLKRSCGQTSESWAKGKNALMKHYWNTPAFKMVYFWLVISIFKLMLFSASQPFRKIWLFIFLQLSLGGCVQQALIIRDTPLIHKSAKIIILHL